MKNAKIRQKIGNCVNLLFDKVTILVYFVYGVVCPDYLAEVKNGCRKLFLDG